MKTEINKIAIEKKVIENIIFIMERLLIESFKNTINDNINEYTPLERKAEDLINELRKY